MLECAGLSRVRECGGLARQSKNRASPQWTPPLRWEPHVESLQKEVKKLSQKLEAVEEYAQRFEKIIQLLRKKEGIADDHWIEETPDKDALQVALDIISEVVDATADSPPADDELDSQGCPMFSVREHTGQTLVLSSTYGSAYSEISMEDVKVRVDSYAERQDKIDLRISELEQRFNSLSLLEQRCSNFEQRLFNVEKLSCHTQRVPQHSPQADHLTTMLGNRHSEGYGFMGEHVVYAETALTEHLTGLSERLQLVEQSVRDSQAELQGDALSLPEVDSKSRDSRLSTASNVALRHLEYKWGSSIWDIAVFIFSEQMNFGESVVVLACLVLTLFLLTAFAQEIDKLIDAKYARFDTTSQQEYYLWRTTVAHDYSFRNKFTDASLASTVCNGKLYAPVSSLQLQTVRDLQDYLTETGYFGVPAGSWMGALSVCVWYLVLVQEFRNMLQLFRASLQLKVGPQTRFEPHMDNDETYQIVSVSYMRRVLLGTLMIFRLASVCTLGWQGSLFLLAEVDLENMILNSVALVTMLTFDDLIYHLVPRIPQEIVKRMQPVKMSSNSLLFGKCWYEIGLFMWFVLFAAIAFLVSHVYYNFTQDLRNSYDALCGGVEGSYDFVVAVDAIGIPWAAATTPASDSMQEAYAQKAMTTARSLRFQDRPLKSSQRFNLGMFMQVASSRELEQAVADLPEFRDPTEWSIIDPVESVDVVGWKDEFLEVLRHQDFADEPGTVYNHYLQHMLKQSGNVSCVDVSVNSCIKPGRKAEDVVMRKLCPAHCGCASPTQGTAANTYGSSSRSVFTGCAAWNTRTETFVHTLRDMPCSDTQSRDSFVSWSRGLGLFKFNSEDKLTDHLVSIFDSGKCPDVAQINLKSLGVSTRVSLCQETSLPSICPESCGCEREHAWTSEFSSRYDFCPYSCSGLQSPCITIALNQRSQKIDSTGPHAEVACKFPFKYKGVTYHKCTSEDWSASAGHGAGWCALTLMDGVVNLWGDCPDTSACVNRST